MAVQQYQIPPQNGFDEHLFWDVHKALRVLIRIHTVHPVAVAR